MSYGKSTNSNHEDRSTCSLQKKRVLLGYTQLGLVVIICFILGIVLPAEFQVVTASQKVQVVFRSAETGVGQHDEYHHHHEQVQQQHASESNGTSSLDTGKPPSLQIAWLMSFPNSGTSYTQKMIRHVTLTRTASNYGNEAKGSKGASITVFADQPTGPFWQDTHIHPEYTLPTDYALTKTHCGGRCENCPPSKYVESISSFRRYCLSGKAVVSVNGTEVMKKSSYSSEKVTKAVHLVRDPFDNVVSRFNLERHAGHSATDSPATRQGFRDFCSKRNQEHAPHHFKSHLHNNEHLDIMKDVPCYADFFRYVEWHNMAFVTSDDLNLETYVLHYDWFATRFNETVQELLDFLRLEAKAEPEPFRMGKVYRDYYTAEEQVAVKQVLESMAMKVTWQNIAQYFHD